MNQRIHFPWLCAIGLCLLITVGRADVAQVSDKPVKELEGVGVTEHLKAQIPLDASFTDENGRAVKLQDYITGGRPVILTLNYYSCPMLCTLQLNGMVDCLKGLNLVPGKDFEIVTMSFNPRESANLAQLKKENYVKSYCPEAARGWHFLVGKQDQIDRVCNTVGYHYKYDAKTNQYAHVAAAVVLTPDGIISRYLYGVFFNPSDPQTLRLSLLEASQGKIGSTIDQVLLFCYHYDPQAGSYALAAYRIMNAAAVLTVIVVFSVLAVFWTREYRKSHPAM